MTEVEGKLAAVLEIVDLDRAGASEVAMVEELEAKMAALLARNPPHEEFPAFAEEFAALPEVYAVAISHRVGPLEIGDVALAAAVSTAHRAAAFAACARLVDEVKARLPIWKRQVFVDGTEEWVNCP